MSMSKKNKIDPAIDETLKRVALDHIEPKTPAKPASRNARIRRTRRLSKHVRETMELCFGAE